MTWEMTVGWIIAVTLWLALIVGLVWGAVMLRRYMGYESKDIDWMEAHNAEIVVVKKVINQK